MNVKPSAIWIGVVGMILSAIMMLIGASMRPLEACLTIIGGLLTYLASFFIVMIAPLPFDYEEEKSSSFSDNKTKGETP